MGQPEVLSFLESCDNLVTRKHIADALGWEPEKVSKILKQLLKWKEVGYIEYQSRKATELAGYILNRRTRFFFAVKS